MTRQVLDTLITAQTPDGIPLELNLAGAYSRSCAFLIDALIRCGIYYAAALAVLLFAGIGAAGSLLPLLALEWIYPVVFELARGSATPGKRIMGLSVLMNSGRTVTPAAAFTRNLMRFVDFLPVMYGFGLLCLLTRRDFKRLGDLAASTRVVHTSRPQGERKVAAAAPSPFTIPIRRRTNTEAADLGARLCHSQARSIYSCYLAVGLPLFALVLMTFPLGDWLPSLAILLAKPWLDRTILFAVSRAAIGRTTTLSDLWQARREVWWQQVLLTFTTQRLSPWRSLTQPVYQLEGLSGAALRNRIVRIRSKMTGSGTLLLSVFSFIELSLTLALFCLVYLVLAHGHLPDPSTLSQGSILNLGTIPDLNTLHDPSALANLSAAVNLPHSDSITRFAMTAAYAIVVLFLEPFYVASGFALYLNRRVELNEWQ